MAIASSLLLLMFLAFFHTCAGGQEHGGAAVANLSSIEAAVRDLAFQLFRRTSEIVVVDVQVFAGAGVEASATRVRSNALWADGVNASAAGFAIPPRVVPTPFARRVAIVFVRFLGNSSSWLFAAPAGYELAAPVAGLLAYDASGPNGEVALRALGVPVRIEFRDLSSAKGFNATTARCLTFATSSGKAVATQAVEPGPSCAVSGTGHYGVAVRVETPPPPPPPPPVRERWWVWKVGVSAGGVAAATFLAISVAGAVRWSRRRRREEMERRAMLGEELGRMAVRGSRMPSAKMVRTRPEVEEGSPLPWRS